MSQVIGKKAPKLSATAVINGETVVKGFNLEQFIDRKYVVLFF